jgi:hypothetical protein
VRKNPEKSYFLFASFATNHFSDHPAQLIIFRGHAESARLDGQHAAVSAVAARGAASR